MTISRASVAGAIPPSLQAALLSRFPLERELGQGGMATVYLARDLRHQRQVAVKVLRPEIAMLLGRERFEREVRVASSLNHPNIIAVHDSGEAAGFLYYVMPAVEGESLAARLARERHLGVEESLRLVREVSEALDYAHARGVVHRDIKPANILLSGGHALVADFGIALALSRVEGDRLTETGLSMGTPAYMSPEQAAGHREVDGRSDQYSLACTLYEMLGGEPPFTGSTPRSVMARQLADPPPPLGTVRPGLPPGLEVALRRALAKIPVDRFETTGAFSRAADASLSGDQVAARMPAAPRRMPRRVVFGTLIVLLAAAAVAIGRAVWSGTGAIRSIAVLPLEPLADTARTYLADGVLEQIVSALVQANGVQVKPPLATRLFWQREHSIASVARGLSAEAVLSLTVVPSGDSLRVTAQLIRGSTQAAIASRSYAAPLSQVLQLAGNVARGVLADAQLRLTTQQSAHLAAMRRVEPEAYDLVQRAAFDFLGDAEHLVRARDLLLRAKDIDPTYVDAWTRLSAVLVELTKFGVASPADVGAQALEAARRAVALDSLDARAHSALARAEFYVNWDRDAASRAYARARELAPGALIDDRSFLLLTGRTDEAIARYRQAARENPLSGQAGQNVGWALFNAGRYEESLRSLRMVLASHPEIASYVREEIAWNLAMLDSGDAAVAEMKQVLPDTAHTSDIVTLSGAVHVYTRAGLMKDARRRLAELEVITRAPHVDPYPLAVSYVIVGDDLHALQMFERVFQERWPSMMFAQVEPWLTARFRALPRVREIFRQAGIPVT